MLKKLSLTIGLALGLLYSTFTPVEARRTCDADCTAGDDACQKYCNKALGHQDDALKACRKACQTGADACDSFTE